MDFWLRQTNCFIGWRLCKISNVFPDPVEELCIQLAALYPFHPPSTILLVKVKISFWNKHSLETKVDRLQWYPTYIGETFDFSDLWVTGPSAGGGREQLTAEREDQCFCFNGLIQQVYVIRYSALPAFNSESLLFAFIFIFSLQAWFTFSKWRNYFSGFVCHP